MEVSAQVGDIDEKTLEQQATAIAFDMATKGIDEESARRGIQCLMFVLVFALPQMLGHADILP